MSNTPLEEGNESDFHPFFPRGKQPEPPRNLSGYQGRKMRHRQGWADYFMEQVETHQGKDYNNWVAALVAATYFGDSIAKMKLRQELDRLKQEGRSLPPVTGTQRLHIAHYQLTGIGREKNPVEAVTTYGKLVEESQSPQAQFALGMCYLDGIVVKKNSQLALDYLKKSADQGYSLASYQYALCLFQGMGESRDLQFCFDTFLDMANRGCAFACTLVGVFYQYGIVVARDPRMAEGYIKHGEKAGFSVDRFGKELYDTVEDLILDYIEDFSDDET